MCLFLVMKHMRHSLKMLVYCFPTQDFKALMGILSWCAADGQWLHLWWGPVGGLCSKCALWGLMQLHHHSIGPVNALPVHVWGFGKSVQGIFCGIRYKVWSTQPPSVGPVLLGLWGVPACGRGCSVDERLPWCPAVWGCKCIYSLLLFFHSLYTWGWLCIGSGREDPPYCYLVCDQMLQRKGEVLDDMWGRLVHRCGDSSIRVPAH